MRRVHIIGGKNQGKTTLVTELVAELIRQGLRVGTIKHTHHQHELDLPGKDSHCHRLAGAAVAGILTPALNAVFWEPQRAGIEPPPTGDARYERFASAYAECDLVIVEGDAHTQAPKFEVWRSATGKPVLAGQLTNVEAIVTDDAPPGPWKTLPRSDVPRLAREIIRLMQLG